MRVSFFFPSSYMRCPCEMEGWWPVFGKKDDSKVVNGSAWVPNVRPRDACVCCYPPSMWNDDSCLWMDVRVYLALLSRVVDCMAC